MEHNIVNANMHKPVYNILVTGGSGFIGTNLVRKLSDNGYGVIVLDNKLPKSPNGIKNTKIYLGDIRDSDFVNSVFKKECIKGVVHLAAVSRVITAEQNPVLCADVNLKGTENVIQSSKRNGKPWIIFGSSREVYGEAKQLPVTEDAPITPINIYGETKAKCERMIKTYSKENDVPSMVLRFSNVYGSWFDHETRVIPLFIRKILSGEKVEINGGKQEFDFTHVNDTIEGIAQAVESICPKTESYYEELHILTGNPHSLQELIEIISKKTGNIADIQYTPARKYDVDKFYGNPDKAENVIGYKSKITLEEGIEKTIADFKQKPLRVLKVIHGFPPYFMAGSEVYSYQLVYGLSKNGVDVGVFTRIEDPFNNGYASEYTIEKGVMINRINNNSKEYILADKYVNDKIDSAFEKFLLEFEPDVVHIGHLSHLSTNIVKIAKKYNIPVVMTIHDFWMFCFRGQMINYEGNICTGPNEKSCMSCLRDRLKDHALLDDFRNYRNHMDAIINSIDVFIAPSEHVADFYKRMGVDKNTIISMRYGFDKNRITYKERKFNKSSKIRFGYTGRVIPVKGIKTVVEAFKAVESKTATLTVYGNSDKYAQNLGEEDERIQFKGQYHVEGINEILNNIDILTVPSEWYEVSPLVIQEALLAGIPVITSELGGMKELIQNGVNGYLVPYGQKNELTTLMQRIVDTPELLNTLRIDPNAVVDIEDQIDKLMGIYEELIQ
jgi:Nucleoside-diphosphate-sugar epimerases